MNRLVRPVLFAFEPDVVFVFARITFGAAGAPTLDTNNSKGLCAVTKKTVAFTATTDGSTAVITSVSSFAGLYVGMTVTGAGIPAATTISSMNAGAATITLSANTTGAHTAEAVTATDGLYSIQFGRNAGVNLDTYNKLLHVGFLWDESGSQGSASTLALAPVGTTAFLVQSLIGVRTIPGTSTSANTDATISFQVGSGAGTSFVAANPASGEALRLKIALCRSGAI